MINPVTELIDFGRAALLRPVPRDHWQEPSQVRRRRIVAAVTLVIGAAVLAYSLRIPAGDPAFYGWTLALAAVWIVGAFASGPLHLGHAWTREGGLGRPVVQSLALAALITGLFLAGAVVVAQIPVLRGPVDALLDHARFGSLPVVIPLTIITGVGEELFFRGALYAGTRNPHQILVTTVAYAAITAATGNPMLVLAAGALGVLVGIERRTTGGVQGPIVIHMTWSTGMLLVLPPIIEARR